MKFEDALRAIQDDNQEDSLVSLAFKQKNKEVILKQGNNTSNEVNIQQKIYIHITMKIQLPGVEGNYPCKFINID